MFCSITNLLKITVQNNIHTFLVICYYTYTLSQWSMHVPVFGLASLHLSELPALSWWRRGPDDENLCQRCLCSSDSICLAYHFPSALPQLMAVSGVLSRHFPHPANGAKVSGPRVIIADRPLSPPASVCACAPEEGEAHGRERFVCKYERHFDCFNTWSREKLRPCKTRASQGSRIALSCISWVSCDLRDSIYHISFHSCRFRRQ